LDGEIDVVEGYGTHPNIVQSTLHPWKNGRESQQYCAWLLTQPGPDSPRFHRPDCGRIEHAASLPRNLASDFDFYAIDWTPDRIVWTLDGIPYFTVRENVPRVPMVLIIDIAISAHWDGAPESPTFSPQSLDVDYIRIYKR
jgi:hypothetical protein